MDPFLAAMENFVGTEEESWKNGARRREDTRKERKRNQECTMRARKEGHGYVRCQMTVSGENRDEE